jgi:hypothetical protein
MPSHFRLTPTQAARTGYTDLFVVTHADLTETTDNTDQTLTLDALAFGDIVKYDAVIQIKTAFDAATISADNAVAVSLGVTGATTQIIGASAISAGGAGTAVTTGYSTAAGGSPYFTPTGGKNLLLTVDITDADGSLAEFTTGELHIWLNISRNSERLQVGDV